MRRPPTRGFGLTASRSAEAGLNAGTCLAAILIASPVAGLRPSRAARCTTTNLPNPGRVTSLPAVSCAAISAKTLHDNPEFCVFIHFLRAELDRIGSEQADLSHNFSVVLLPSNFPS